MREQKLAMGRSTCTRFGVRSWGCAGGESTAAAAAAAAKIDCSFPGSQALSLSSKWSRPRWNRCNCIAMAPVYHQRAEKNHPASLHTLACSPVFTNFTHIDFNHHHKHHCHHWSPQVTVKTQPPVSFIAFLFLFLSFISIHLLASALFSSSSSSSPPRPLKTCCHVIVTLTLLSLSFYCHTCFINCACLLLFSFFFFL